ncbi:MAG: hypothetical protein OJF50_006628 [Nitrospira sp.]|jgi:hypothetical protein|nr:hypothetical protein [Nitrospira sp.]
MLHCPREHCHGLLLPTDEDEAPQWRCFACSRRYADASPTPAPSPTSSQKPQIAVRLVY